MIIKNPALSANPGHRGLRLEVLESRTLLAGTDPDYLQVVPAMSGSGDYSVEFNPRYGNHQLVIVGTKDSSLTIDFDRLPAFVTSIAVSSFDKVEFTGTDKLEKLIAADIGSLRAPGITLQTGLSTSNVAEVSLAFPGETVVMKGASTDFETGNLVGTTIVSDLQLLEITSTGTEVFVISLNSSQEVRLNYEPSSVWVVGLANWEKQIVFANQLPDGPSTPGGGVVVVEVPTDERTDLLLSRLRDLLRSPQIDGQQMVFDFVTTNSLRGGRNADSSIDAIELLPHALTHLRPSELARFSQQPVEIGTTAMLAAESSIPVLPDAGAATAWVHSAGSGQVPFEGLAASTLDGAVVIGDGDVEMIGLAEAAADQLPTIRVEELWGVYVASLEDSPRDFARHILDRISDELSPTKQTAFLLVDPKTARSPAEKNRELLFG